MATIQVLGTGCARCSNLAAIAERVVKESGRNDVIEKVIDINEIVKAGVMLTPALAIDGKVLSQGKILPPTDIAKFLSS